jgi:hypothetical protein
MLIKLIKIKDHPACAILYTYMEQYMKDIKLFNLKQKIEVYSSYALEDVLKSNLVEAFIWYKTKEKSSYWESIHSSLAITFSSNYCFKDLYERVKIYLLKDMLEKNLT